MKNLFFLILFILLSLPDYYGQNRLEIDKLINEANSSQLDSIKIGSYFRIYDAFINNEADSAIVYLNKVFTIIDKDELSLPMAIAYDKMATYFYVNSEFDSSSYYQKKSIDVFKGLDNTSMYGRALFNTSISSYTKGKYHESIEYLDDAANIFTDTNDTFMLAATYVMQANCNKFIGYRKIALEKFYLGIKMHESLGPSTHLADGYLSIGLFLNDEDKFEDAATFLDKAVNMFNDLEAKNYMAQSMAYKAENLICLDELTEVDSLLNLSLVISKEIGYESNTARSLHFFGSYFEKKNQDEMALNQYIQAAQKYERIGKRANEAGVYLAIGELKLKNGQNKDAIIYLNKAYEIVQDVKNVLIIKNVLKLRSKAYDKNGNYSEAMEDIKAYQNLSDSLFLNEKELAVEELNVIYKTEIKEADLALQKEQILNLHQEIKISNLQKVSYGIGLIGTFVAAFLGFFWFRQKSKNEKIKSQAREDVLLKEIEFKKKELASQTLHLVQKNTFIQNLAQELEGKNISGDNNMKETNKILTTLKLEPEHDKDWDLFKSYFTEVHNDFDGKIKKLCPDISDNEIRLAYLLRMKLNTSEIGAVLRVLPESVRKSKYRFKKKLGLDKEQDLLEYLVAV